jgi:hypothetical protein
MKSHGGLKNMAALLQKAFDEAASLTAMGLRYNHTYSDTYD